MKTTMLFIKISMIVKELFSRKSSADIEAMKSHFSSTYSNAQLFALVLVGMVLRVFGLTPDPEPGSRSLWSVVGMLIEFIEGLHHQPDIFRSGPNPLDELVEEGIDQVGEHG